MKKIWVILITATVFLFAWVSCRVGNDNSPKRLEILFLGHENNRGHNSERLAEIFLKEYFK